MENSKPKRNVKGQGCFVEQKNGRYLYRKSVGYNSQGKRKVLTVTASSKATCIQLMKEKEALWEKEQRRLEITDVNTVEELCQRHLEFQVKNDELKPKSIDRREDTIKNQIARYPFGHFQVRAVTPSDVENHMAALTKAKLSTSSIKKALDVLNAAYEWAVARGDLVVNPVLQIKKTIVRRLTKLETKEANEADVIVLSEEEEQRFLAETLRRNANNGEYKYAGGLYGRLLLHTGMRVGEMISLKWEDYDEKNGLLTICKSTSVTRNRDGGDRKYVSVQGTTKNQKARIIQLFPEAVEDLRMIFEEKRGKPGDLICRTRNGRAYTATMMEHCMNTVYRNAGLDEAVSGLHVFRRTFATRLYEGGAEVKDIAAYVGDLESTTRQYYIAARRKVRVGEAVTQMVPMPGGKRKVPAAGEDS
ncbi:MAG: tyrosine-type recombinase/integrase [Lachnospiraceae bacterium]|nr:tyrosine-type recombinase/integrase [Lachnospiraceae bacterium]